MILSAKNVYSTVFFLFLKFCIVWRRCEIMKWWCCTSICVLCCIILVFITDDSLGSSLAVTLNCCHLIWLLLFTCRVFLSALFELTNNCFVAAWNKSKFLLLCRPRERDATCWRWLLFSEKEGSFSELRFSILFSIFLSSSHWRLRATQGIVK